MHSVEIVNMYLEDPTFRCDRKSPVGNPFRMKCQSQRQRVCNEYEKYFYRNLNPDVAPPGFLEYLSKMLETAKNQDITLGCWCAPKKCHCDTIKSYIELQLKE